MKNELITYRPDDSEQVLIDASQKALEGLGLFGGNTSVTASYDLLTALSEAVNRSNLILVLITKSEYIKIKKIVSKSLGIELTKNITISKRLGRLADDKEFQLHDHFPKGSVVLDSKDTLYSGFYLKSGNQCIVFSPLDMVRTEGILEKAGIKLNIECVVKHKVRFVGVPASFVEQTVSELGGAKSFSVDNLGGELELTMETVGTTYELAEQHSSAIISELRKTYRSKMYGVDCAPLPVLVASELESDGKQLAIADTENSARIVTFLAADKRAGELCKKIRTSTSQVQAITQEEVSSLAKKARIKSGFDLAIAIGDEDYDEEKKRSYIYGAFANEQGVLTKRFWMQPNEGSVDFRVRCAKELVLMLYNDRIGDEDYSSMKNNAKHIKPPKAEKPPRRETPVVTQPEKPAPVEVPPEVIARRKRVAPEEDKSLTRTKVLFMLGLVVVVIVMAILISRAPESDNSGAGGGSSTTTTTTTTTTTLPSCDMCGKDIEGEVKTYVDSDGNEQTLCQNDYDFMISIEG